MCSHRRRASCCEGWSRVRPELYECLKNSLGAEGPLGPDASGFIRPINTAYTGRFACCWAALGNSCWSHPSPREVSWPGQRAGWGARRLAAGWWIPLPWDYALICHQKDGLEV